VKQKQENKQKQQDKIANIKANKAAIWENRFEIMEGNPDITFEDFIEVSNLPTLNEEIDAWYKIVTKKGKPLVTPKEETKAEKKERGLANFQKIKELLFVCLLY
jgi:hypothetical protein